MTQIVYTRAAREKHKKMVHEAVQRAKAQVATEKAAAAKAAENTPPLRKSP